jgi:hypothetical protein
VRIIKRFDHIDMSKCCQVLINDMQTRREIIDEQRHT